MFLINALEDTIDDTNMHYIKMQQNRMHIVNMHSTLHMPSVCHNLSQKDYTLYKIMKDADKSFEAVTVSNP